MEGEYRWYYMAVMNHSASGAWGEAFHGGNVVHVGGGHYMAVMNHSAKLRGGNESFR